MLSNRTAGQPSRITIATLDDAGEAIVATGASWEMFDERGVSITAGAVADFDAEVPSVSFDLSAEDLALGVGPPSAGRELVVYLTTAAGEIEVRDYFVLVARNPLSVADNSFMTFAEALALQVEMVSLDGFLASTVVRQQAALAEAYRRICRIPFRVPGIRNNESSVSYASFGTGTDDPYACGRRVRVSLLTLEQFDALPEPFRRALKRCQLAEANILLGGDPVGRKREEGIISETIGESSTFYQSRPFLNLPISKQAYEEVKRYVTFSVTISRT